MQREVASEEEWWAFDQAISVDELVRRLGDAVADVEGGNSVAVRGELDRWVRAGSGHCYASLRGDRSQIRVVMYRRQAAQLKRLPDPGADVVVVGRPALYYARGTLEFIARQLRQVDVSGPTANARSALVARLAAEGVFSAARRRPLPTWPEVIGLVASPSSAAYVDVVDGLKRHAPWVRIVTASAPMEGPAAAGAVVEALRRLSSDGAVEVVVIARGGGDASALEAFHSEGLARAILANRTPVITAIGHTPDQTVADLVADLSVGTPSAAVASVTLGTRHARDLLAVARGGVDRVSQHVASWRSKRARFATFVAGRPRGIIRAARADVKARAVSLQASMVVRVLAPKLRMLGTLRGDLNHRLQNRHSADAYTLTRYRAVAIRCPDMVRSAQGARCQASVLLNGGLRRALARCRLRVDGYKTHRGSRLLQARYTRAMDRCRRFGGVLRPSVGHRITRLRTHLQTRAHVLGSDLRSALASAWRGWSSRDELVRALSPGRVLERGYAIVLGPAGAVRASDEVHNGDRVTIRLSRGSVTATIVARRTEWWNGLRSARCD